jgi:hypothetical protein
MICTSSPQWRETFNELLDAELKLPDRGNVLDAGCGTETLRSASH